ncbi:hypothetical protein VSR01_08905 [Actinacidiphila sp. DG2A-62]|uniref:hypothetical protein n=1 Tax=Actinacidiphila sp. DG2A-62 TaxID=3108821 RepID=UPI002DB7CE9B|nr:hypothetical protein [Actinacidiphila sp. DG2A-62]MEC3993649.1 hypothetical protein [Actinacidiphila sp. DG2A-62]
MTERHLLPNGALRSWRVERAPGAPELTQAGRVAIPVRLRRLGRRLSGTTTVLVLTAEEADALCVDLAALLRPGGGQEAAS